MDKKNQARQAAIARSRPTPGRAPGAQGGQAVRQQNRQNQFTFYTEDSTGLKLSPKTVLILSLLYMAIVVLLHIFGKIKNAEIKKEMWSRTLSE